MTATLAGALLAAGLPRARAQARRSPPPAEPKVKPQQWQMGTAPVGGTYYTLGAAIAKLVNAKVPGLQIVAQVSPGSNVENGALLMAREIQLGMSDAHDLLVLVSTAKPWQRMRVMFSQHLSPIQFVVRRDSPIKSPGDYRDKRVAVGNPRSGMNSNNAQVLSAGWGITFKDMQTHQIHVAPGLQGIRDGNLDAVNIPTSAPVASILELARTTPIRLLSLTPEEVARIRAAVPDYVPITIPKGTYPGQETDVHTVGPVAYMLTHDETDPEAVYWTTRTVFEHLADLRQAHPAARDFAAEAVPKNCEPLLKAGYQFHPGAARYFKEIGLLG
jgi:TRAP transporter TAXI family solute receptor